MERVWIRNGWVFTGGDHPRAFAGGVLCQGARIERVGPDPELQPLATGAEELDAGGRLILPGFINAHMHLYSTLSRGMGLKDPPPADFNQILERLWWRLDKQLTLADLGPSAELPLLDALRAGVTTVLDHHASPRAIDGSLDVLAEAAQRLGVRFSTCYEVSDRDGPEAFRAGLAENLRFARRVKGEPMLAAMFGLHASFTLSDESLRACADAARGATLACHVHVAEAASDAADARRRGAAGPLARLAALGALPPGSLAVHCVHTHMDEWALLRRADGYAVHNPQSNMNNAVGAAPVEAMQAAGVRVGLGTDGMQADVRQDARAAFLLMHHRTADPRTAWGELGGLLAVNRELASRLFGVRLGALEPGAAADVVVYEHHPPTPLDAGNFLGHLLFGLYQVPARDVVVGGRVRLRAGEAPGVDPAALAARARALAVELWRRF
ncbi:MAG TPA: putative aminohydrolase SsnA [Myxococcota bacterium]|nr:putative aminohydrolase SsnA [Myxococcota bacterium]HRY94368.1 putative aminohydrolase SsnA [Myxococcota bacterium]HSA22925.1 putative aminohydrolase SsnA [Myxococcota bacterium]